LNSVFRKVSSKILPRKSYGSLFIIEEVWETINLIKIGSSFGVIGAPRIWDLNVPVDVEDYFYFIKVCILVDDGPSLKSPITYYGIFEYFLNPNHISLIVLAAAIRL